MTVMSIIMRRKQRSKCASYLHDSSAAQVSIT